MIRWFKNQKRGREYEQIENDPSLIDYYGRFRLNIMKNLKKLQSIKCLSLTAINLILLKTSMIETIFCD